MLVPAAPRHSRLSATPSVFFYKSDTGLKLLTPASSLGTILSAHVIVGVDLLLTTIITKSVEFLQCHALVTSPAPQRLVCDRLTQAMWRPGVDVSTCLLQVQRPNGYYTLASLVKRDKTASLQLFGG